jgi:LPS-assembly lipoprotein
MSLPDHFQPVLKRLLCACVLGMALIAGGCQVRPLYSATSPVASTGAGVTGSVRSRMATIAINEPPNRETQEVRNHLIFLFAGGAGEPDSPAYSMQLSVLPQYLSLMLVQNATNDKSGQPTAGLVRMTGSYVVTRISDGQVVGRGSRIVTANYDAPRQRYAVTRAVRDAANRAGRELAEALNLSVAQDLSKF